MKKPRPDQLPIVYVHMHMTTVYPVPIKALIPLRDAIHELIKEHAQQYGLRVKRKQAKKETGELLWQAYEGRAKVFNLID
jgi:hypothetical protein